MLPILYKYSSKGQAQQWEIKVYSDRFSKLLEDSEWLYYLNCAGVDNWEGYSVAHDLKKEDSE